jgi:hypothetical protein
MPNAGAAPPRRCASRFAEHALRRRAQGAGTPLAESPRRPVRERAADQRGRPFARQSPRWYRLDEAGVLSIIAVAPARVPCTTDLRMRGDACADAAGGAPALSAQRAHRIDFRVPAPPAPMRG